MNENRQVAESTLKLLLDSLKYNINLACMSMSKEDLDTLRDRLLNSAEEIDDFVYEFIEGA